MYGVDAAGALVAHEEETWFATLREGLTCPRCPPPARLVPHVSLDGLDYEAVFGGEDSESQAGRLLVSLLHTAATHTLDGFVLDAHASLARVPRGRARDACARALHLFVQLLAAKLSELEPRAELLLLVPPHPALFSAEQFAQLAEPLGGIILSTANYSAIRGTAGPSAPLAWMKQALAAMRPDEARTPKLMATLPMLGWDFELPDGDAADGSAAGGVQMDALGGGDYLRLLGEHAPARFEWVAEAAEHVFRYRDNRTRHAVYYPSLKGLAERLGLLRNLGVGVAIWELGTGLDYFFDLL